MTTKAPPPEAETFQKETHGDWVIENYRVSTGAWEVHNLADTVAIEGPDEDGELRIAVECSACDYDARGYIPIAMLEAFLARFRPAAPPPGGATADLGDVERTLAELQKASARFGAEVAAGAGSTAHMASRRESDARSAVLAAVRLRERGWEQARNYWRGISEAGTTRIEALERRAREVVEAYDACRAAGSMAGFWTHLDDLAAELDGRALVSASPPATAPPPTCALCEMGIEKETLVVAGERRWVHHSCAAEIVRRWAAEEAAAGDATPASPTAPGAKCRGQGVIYDRGVPWTCEGCGGFPPVALDSDGGTDGPKTTAPASSSVEEARDLRMDVSILRGALDDQTWRTGVCENAVREILGIVQYDSDTDAVNRVEAIARAAIAKIAGSPRSSGTEEKGDGR